MSPVANQLFESALVLSDDERAELADRIWRSIDGDTQEEIVAAWDAEIQRRLAAIERGEAKFLTDEEVKRRLEPIYGPLLD